MRIILLEKIKILSKDNEQEEEISSMVEMKEVELKSTKFYKNKVDLLYNKFILNCLNSTKNTAWHKFILFLDIILSFKFY